MLPRSTSGWLEGWNRLTTGCCNTPKVHSVVFLVVPAGCDWGLSWSYHSEHPNVASPCVLDSLTALWLVPSASAETGRIYITFSNLASESCSMTPTVILFKKEINHKGLSRFGRNEGASPLDKCCGGSERVFGARNTVVAILEKRRSVTIGKNIWTNKR